jgi:general secretion pathway protein A
MYLDHYNLTEKPFQITADPKFLWLGEKHQEALAMLKYGVLDSKGFLLLTGDVGTGKTTLINALLGDLDSSIVVATMVDPNLEKLEFSNFLARAFGIEETFTTKVDFLKAFSGFLNDAYANGKRVLLIIDEAHRLSAELLEEIRLLSNIEKENRKLINIFFVGQDEFKNTLMKQECRALRQRIATIHQIHPLTKDETGAYIRHRLKIAGTQERIFRRKAIRKIHAFAHGYPRLINIICDHALLTGYSRDTRTIGPSIVKECAQELAVAGEVEPTLVQRLLFPWRTEKKHLQRAALYGCLVLCIAFGGYLWYIVGHEDYVQNVKHYYGQMFAGPGCVTPEHPARDIKPSDRAQFTESLPVHQALEDEIGVQPVVGYVKSQEPLADVNRGDAYSANVATIEGPHADPAVSEEEITDDVGGNLHTPTYEEPLLFSDGKLIIPFGHDKAGLPDKASDTLERLVTVMAERPEINVVVKGHTDTLGPPPYNKRLSELRANAVKDYLVAKGISPLRIQTIGMGRKDPLQPNTTVAGRKANRRAEIELQTARRR